MKILKYTQTTNRVGFPHNSTIDPNLHIVGLQWLRSKFDLFSQSTRLHFEYEEWLEINMTEALDYRKGLSVHAEFG